MTGRGGPFEVDIDKALEALRGDWDGLYVICYDQAAVSRWQAWRLDSIGVMVAGDTPDELAAAIRADWGARRTR